MLGYSGVSEWIQCSNEGPYKREAGEDVRAEAYEVRERFNGAPSLALNMVEVAKEDMWPQETRQGKKMDFCWSLRKKYSSANTLTSGLLTSRTVER